MISTSPRLPSLHRIPLLAVLLLAASCSSGGEPTGQPCSTASDCYSGIDASKLQGEVQCLDKVQGGYCTHLCQADSDCCAVSGECPAGHPEVCAPFESTGKMMCFLSCEEENLDGLEEAAYCQQYAGEAFGCRSTGGGSKNRKICSP